MHNFSTTFEQTCHNLFAAYSCNFCRVGIIFHNIQVLSSLVYALVLVLGERYAVFYCFPNSVDFGIQVSYCLLSCCHYQLSCCTTDFAI